MEGDPFDVLGIPHGASREEAEEAYRRLAARWHPDHLEQRGAEARAEGERRLRDLNAAITAIRAMSRAYVPVDPDPTTADSAHEFNAQVRDSDPAGLHASWPGPHAAGVWSALRRAHKTDGLVHQVEWGSFECRLAGADVRRLLRSVLDDATGPWENEPLDLLEVGHTRHRRRMAGSRRRENLGDVSIGGMDLGQLDRLIDERRSYVVTAEVI